MIEITLWLDDDTEIIVNSLNTGFILRKPGSEVRLYFGTSFASQITVIDRLIELLTKSRAAAEQALHAAPATR